MKEKLVAAQEEYEINRKNQIEITQQEVNKAKEVCQAALKDKEIAECARCL